MVAGSQDFEQMRVRGRSGLGRRLAPLDGRHSEAIDCGSARVWKGLAAP